MKRRSTRSARTTPASPGRPSNCSRRPATSRWLDWAEQLTALQTERFFDAADGGWFSTTGDDPSVLLRLKEDYDGAEPSAASVTVRNLIRLSQLTGDASYLARAERTLERYGSGLGQVVRVMPMMMANVALWHGRRAEIVLVGTAGSSDLAALERVVAGHYAPWAVTVTLRSRGRDARAHAVAVGDDDAGRPRDRLRVS